jgi:AcrB/AcrD/AcrF family
MAQFFIRRPIVAIVISILIVMLGVVTIKGLSIEQYPFLAPPTIRVTATYPGASAVAVEQSVATPIEQEVNGVDRLIYMKSSNTSDGRMQLDVNFEVGTDQDMANVLTQNRVSAAQARLPQEAVQQGVTVKKMSPSILMLISVYSPKDAYDANFLINYCGINLRDQLLRIPGQAGPDPGGRHLGHQGAEPSGARREGRRRPHTAGSAIHRDGHRAGPPGHNGGVREHHCPPERHRRRGPDQGCRARRTGLAGLQLLRAAER